MVKLEWCFLVFPWYTFWFTYIVVQFSNIFQIAWPKMVNMIMNWNVGPICSKLYVSSCGGIEIPNNHKVSLLSTHRN